MPVSKFPAIWKTCTASCFFFYYLRHKICGITISEYSSSNFCSKKSLLQASVSVRKAQLSTTFDLTDLTPQNSPHHVYPHSFSNLWKSHPAATSFHPPISPGACTTQIWQQISSSSSPNHPNLPNCTAQSPSLRYIIYVKMEIIILDIFHNFRYFFPLRDTAVTRFK